MYTLRPYQSEAKEAILNEWNAGHRKTLLVLPTAAGKTVVFASVAENQVNKDDKVLILAHRDELLTQAADKLQKAVGLDSVFEKGKQTSLGSDIPITISSVQSMSKEKRLERFPEDYFQDIIVDEAHHCLTNTYQTVLNHFPNANVLGVTATPDRGDMRNLGEFFDTKAYEYTMAQGIKDGYLSPVKAQMIPLKLNIENVGIARGDFKPREVGNALEPYLEQIAGEMKEYCKDRKTVVFLPLIKMSQEFCEILNRVGFSAAEIHGTSSDRAEILSDFEKGRYNVLCNSMLLTEGWDCPSVDCIIVLRPTKIRSLYQQIIGRGMRIAPGKKDLLILDFLWLTGKHDLCKPSALISKDEDVAKKIDDRMMREDEPFDLVDAEEQAERDVQKEREHKLAAELAKQRNKKQKLVDPLQYAVSIEDDDLTAYEPSFAWEMGPATDKQLSYLEKLGISSNTVPNAGYASMLIDRLVRRRKMGLSSPKQIRCLENYGFEHVGMWGFEDAKRTIKRIADNGWAIPNNINPRLHRA